MAASQQHGLDIEQRIREEFQRRNRSWLPSRLPLEPGYTARFDVPGYVDPYGQGISTSIKSAKLQSWTGNALVCLADATRIADLTTFDTTRLLVALYEQKGNQKIFREIREYLITGAEWEKLTGGVSAELMAEFNREIKISSATRARLMAKKWKARLAEQFPDTLIRWNPKIDSRGQRRIQCSVHLRDIEKVISDPARIKVFGSPKDPPGVVRPLPLRPISRHLWGDGLRFPIVLNSPPRVRSAPPADVQGQGTDSTPSVPIARPRRLR